MEGNPEKLKSSSESLAERQRELYEGLSNKVRIINDIIKLIQEMPETTSAEDMITQVDDAMARIVDSFPADIKNELSRLLTIDQEIEEISFVDYDYSEVEDRDIDAEMILYEESNKLHQGLDTEFLYQITKGAESLKDKVSLIAYRGSKDEMLQHALIRGGFTDKSCVKEIHHTPYSVSLVIDKDVWNKQKANLAGFYATGTPFVYVRETSDRNKLQSTLRHEYKHLLLDGVSAVQNKNPLSQTLMKLKNHQMVQQFSPKTSEGVLFGLNSELAAWNLVDCCHEEIVAEFNSSRLVDFSGQLNYKDKEALILDSLFGNRGNVVGKRELIESLVSMSTAGNQLYRTLETLSKICADEKDEKLKDVLQVLISRIKESYMKMINNLRLCNDMCMMIGPEAEEDLETLATVLRPSKYHHIPGYLKYKYGDKKITLIEQQALLLGRGVFTYTSLSLFIENIKDTKSELPSNLFKIRKFSCQEAISTIEDTRKLFDLIRAFSTSMLDTSDSIELFERFYIIKRLREAILNAIPFDDFNSEHSIITELVKDDFFDPIEMSVIDKHVKYLIETHKNVLDKRQIEKNHSVISEKNAQQE